MLGKSYNGKTAYAVLSQALDAYEFNFVAVPAQREEGVTKSYENPKGVDNMENISKMLRKCDGEIVLNKSQAYGTADYIERLEVEVKLGREYKKEFADEVVRLCAVAIPEMDIKVFRGIAQVMTANELKAFKNAFTSKKRRQKCRTANKMQ
ncbi:MAG: hypothetical protein LUG95_07505 [Clostridiales bacterium]|nr:hypothetical protein [Clostridiales bacterium]